MCITLIRIECASRVLSTQRKRMRISEWVCKRLIRINHATWGALQLEKYEEDDEEEDRDGKMATSKRCDK